MSTTYLTCAHHRGAEYQESARGTLRLFRTDPAIVEARFAADPRWAPSADQKRLLTKYSGWECECPAECLVEVQAPVSLVKAGHEGTCRVSCRPDDGGIEQ